MNWPHLTLTQQSVLETYKTKFPPVDEAEMLDQQAKGMLIKSTSPLSRYTQRPTSPGGVLALPPSRLDV